MTSRAALSKLLLEQGLLFHTDERPLLHPLGGHARWMLDTLRFSLTDTGARLAGEALLELARTFDADQLATYGTAGIPLVQAMVLGAKGRYRGLVIRKAVERSGTGERIEGGIDLTRPVILVDDSISSGGSLREATRLLREAGAEVAGAISLVRFSYPVVAALERELRFPVRSVFDAGRDFAARLDAGLNRSRPSREPPWGRRAPDGLTAVELVRRVLDVWLETGKVLRPPARLARRYEARGGCFVSLRRRDDLSRQLARSGFWHLPGEPRWSAAESLVRAAWQTGLELEPASLAGAAIAVTVCGPLEPCDLREVDNQRFGLVARSLERPEVVGGALPRMSGIADDWGQFCHAAYRNARLWPREPFALFRHTVAKEAEVAWEPGGVAAPVTWEHERSRVAKLVTALRRQVLRPGRRALEVPAGPNQLFVTVYRDGEVKGCVGGDANEAQQWARLAARDARLQRSSEVSVCVSLLRTRAVSDPARLQPGQQAVSVRSGQRQALLLPAVALHRNWSRDELVAAALRKAGIRRGGAWSIADCVTWLDDGEGVRRIEGALPVSAPRRESLPVLARELKRLLAGFLTRVHRRSGPPVTSYHPFDDTLRTSVVPVWLAHLAWTKACLGLKRAAREDLRRIPERDRSLGALAFRTLAELELRGRSAKSLANTLEQSIDARGRVATKEEDEQAYAPGQVLFALAACARRGLVAEPTRALDYYQRWFRRERRFEAVCSLAQAFAAWKRSEVALEISETVLPYQCPSGQLGTPGLTEIPGASTATYLEGLVAGCRAARVLGETRRAHRLLAAIDSSVRFLERLVYQPRDFAVLPNPDWALGGLRLSATRSDVRVDFVQHFLQALRALD